MTDYRVVFHLDEADKARAQLVLNNIKNLIVDLGRKNVEIELIANGQGVLALLETPNLHGKDVERLADLGVRFLACSNSLEALNVPEEILLDPIEVVPAGITTLVKRQAEGWAYVRP
jgi:hypothetical protein